MQNAQTETECARRHHQVFSSPEFRLRCVHPLNQELGKDAGGPLWSRRVQGGSGGYDIREQTDIQDMPRRQPTHRSSIGSLRLPDPQSR